MPRDTGASFVVVQHLSPDFRSLMDDLLARQTTMTIRRVEDDMELEPDTLYLIPPRKLMRVEGGRLRLSDRVPDRAGELPINVFLNSLAADAGARGVAVILSGTGSDGTEGAASVRKAGGLVLAQDPDTAEFDGMPRSVIARGVVDHVLPPGELARCVAKLALDPAAREALADIVSDGAGLDEETSAELGELAPVVEMLRKSTGLDFGQYKIATVRRRIERRMHLGQHADVAAYVAHLSTRPEELDTLYRDLLIGVTGFFRDPEIFEALREQVLRPLMVEPGRTELRAWVAGCATGEEAYSLAILLDEEVRAAGFIGGVTVFATDAHRTSLERASTGIYEETAMAGVSAERRANYFRATKDGRWRVAPELRTRVVFAPHNLLADPPFTKLDLVSCRNLLIYLSPEAQERVLGLFHYGLRLNAIMLLGQSEGLGRLATDFEVVDGRHKIFRKNRDSRLPLDLRPARALQTRRNTAPTVPLAANAPGLPRGLLHAYDHLLASHLAPGFLITVEGEVVHFIGEAARYLLPQSGRVVDSILARTSGDLRLALSTLVPQAVRDRTVLRSRGLRVEVGGGAVETINLEVQPLPPDRSGSLLIHVSITQAETPPSVPSTGDEEQVFASAGAHQRRIFDLEQELLAVRESLQATVEELQTTNEELQAANEEMLAANEELQSTNEELHSVNEELYTVNAEFERKNQELLGLNSDLDLLFGAIDAGVLFLDRRLRIRKFNASIGDIFRLIDQDIGRPIEHIAYQLADQAGMIEDVRHVLTTGEPREGEVRTRDGHWLLKRILPSRGSSRAIDGVVLTFTRIDLVKSMQNQLDLAMTSSRLIWWEWEVSSGEFHTHAGGTCILGYDLCELAPHVDTWMERIHPEDVAYVRKTLDACLAGATPDWECEHRFRAADGHWKWVLEKGRVVQRDDAGRAARMVGTTQDIDTRHNAEAEVARLSHAVQQAQVSVVITDTAGKIEYVNPHFSVVTGYTAEEVIGKNPRVLKSGITPAEVYETMWSTITKGQSWSGEIVNRRKNGSLLHERVSISPVEDRGGRVIQYLAVKEDISALKEEEARRAKLEHQLAQSQKMETLGTLAGGIAHDFNNILMSILGYAEIAQSDLPAGHPARSSLHQIETAGRRAASLVRRILGFSRRHAPNHEVVVLGSVVSEAVSILRASVPTTIALEFSDESAGALVLGDPTQLQQVVLNLGANSAHAIGARNGCIQFTVTQCEVESQVETLAGEVKPGNWLRLTVGDSGTGMPASVIERMFEPFFTTKGPGEGTGLGLAIVHSTVLGHGGGVAVQSAIGHGTRFHIYLPLVKGVQTASAEQSASKNATPDRPKNAVRRVAAVDDDASIAQLNAMALSSQGFDAVAITAARECLNQLLNDPHAFDLIVTDQTMPEMTGLELLQTLRAAGNPVPVLLISGYTQVVDPGALQLLQPAAFLAKPFELTTLLHSVGRLLESK